MEEHMNWAAAVFVLGFWVWIIMITGDPDLIDAAYAAASRSCP